MPKRRTKTKAPGVSDQARAARDRLQGLEREAALRGHRRQLRGSEGRASRPHGEHGTRRQGRPHKGQLRRLRGNVDRELEPPTATLDAYRYALDHHILPRFKNRRVADITPDDVARMVSEMRRAGYSEWTISGAVSTLSGCLSKALRRGLIASNACRALAADERPKQRSGKKRVLSDGDPGGARRRHRSLPAAHRRDAVSPV